MKTDTVIILGAMGVAGYLLYKLFSKGSDAVDKVSSAIADAWLRFRPLPPAVQLLGNIKFPGNIMVPLQQLSKAGAIKQGDDGSVLVKYADHIWSIAPSNAYGNWPATLVR